MKNISIIGIGRLGLCFGLTLEKVNYNVLGCDVYQSYVDQVNDKTLKSHETGVEQALLQSTNFKATTDLKKTVDYSDILFVIVATPSLENGRYDHSQIDALVQKIKKFGAQERHKHFVICCTTMPGYCDTVQKRLQEFNYTVSYNPEFIAQGTILKDQSRPDMVLIGEGSAEAGDILQKIYENHIISKPRFCRMSRTEAEICKISLNCFVTTKISFANMIGDIVIKSGGDPKIVLEAIGTDSRVGNKYLGYGFGYGGPCFPRDNRALAIYANDLDMPADISVATDRLNTRHLNFQVKNFTENHDKGEPIFFDGDGGEVDGKIVFEGITYKKGTTIIEESQQLLFAAQLAKIGYDVIIIDYEETILKVKEIYEDLFYYEVISD